MCYVEVSQTLANVFSDANNAVAGLQLDEKRETVVKNEKSDQQQPGKSDIAVA